MLNIADTSPDQITMEWNGDAEWLIATQGAKNKVRYPWTKHMDETVYLYGAVSNFG